MKSPRAGFTLIELLLTLGVLAIGLTSIFALLPGVMNFSRELREEDRMRTFAEAVFSSVEWSLQQPENPDPLSGERKRRLPHLLGTQELNFGGTEHSWPDTGGVEDLVPVFFYTLTLQTNSPREVEVRLLLRPQTRDEAVEYSRILYPQVEAW